MINRLLHLTASALFTLSASAGSLTVELRAEPSSVLPGIPFHFVMTVQNVSPEPQSIPIPIVVRVRSESGEWFIPSALPEFVVGVLPKEYWEMRTLKPQETRAFEIPLASCLTDGSLGDPRIWRPGDYHVQVVLGEDLKNNEVAEFGIDGLLGAGRIHSPLLVSSLTTLHVEQPQGEDQFVWSEILKRTNGRGLFRMKEDEAEAIARKLWTRDEASAYTPYLAAYIRRRTESEGEEIRRRILEHYPTHEVADEMRLGWAASRAYRARVDLMQGAALEAVLARTDEARAELVRLQRDAQSDLLKLRAVQELSKITSREKLIEMHEALVVKQ